MDAPDSKLPANEMIGLAVRGVLAAIGLVVLLYGAAIGLLLMLLGTCDHEELSRVRAPDGEHEIIEFERSCGTKSARHAALVRVGEEPTGDTESFDSAKWSESLRRYHWEDPGNLVVCGLTVFDSAYEGERDGIQIHYEPSCPGDIPWSEP